MLDYIADIRQRPVWQPAAASHRAALPYAIAAERHCAQRGLKSTFQQHILPYAVGNAHPGFMGWVHGGGNVVGMLAEMLAAGLNSNLGGRDHIPIAVEQQVVRWMAELFGFPSELSGLFVTGSSLANFIAMLIAQTSGAGYVRYGAGGWLACGRATSRWWPTPRRERMVAWPRRST